MKAFAQRFFLEPPEILKRFCLISTQGLIFFYMIFWYFFLLLLWPIIFHQLFLLWVIFIFGSMEKTATCLNPGIRDFGQWFWKTGREPNILQPLNGLISNKKQKRWPFPIGAQLCDWLIVYWLFLWSTLPEILMFLQVLLSSWNI